MTESTNAIFLSYASQNADAARRIGDALREAGLEVWFDQIELRGGDAWDEMIRRQIAECALFIPIISAATAARLEGYFRLEWTLADQRTQRMARTKTFIVPVCIDAPESNEPARAAYQKAIALDAGYAAAYSGLADAEWRLADMQTNNPDDYVRASAAAEKAIALAPGAPEGYWARAQLRCLYYYDWSGAQADYEKALALDPAFGPAGVDYAQLLATLGKVPEAIGVLRQIIARDPLSGPAWRRLARLLMDSGRLTEVPEAIARIRAISGGDDAKLFSAELALYEGRSQQALENFRSPRIALRRPDTRPIIPAGTARTGIRQPPSTGVRDCPTHP